MIFNVNRYKITYSEPNRRYIAVEAIFEVADNQTILQFPAWRPGRYELGNFAKNIHSFQVSDSSGKVLNAVKTTKDSWILDTSNTSSIRVTYRYYAADLNAGSTYMDDRQLYVNPVNCLIYIPGRENEACVLDLDIPSSFEIACGARVDDQTIHAASYHELVDSPFIASAHMQHDTYEISGVTYHLWFMGAIEVDWNRLKKDFTTFSRSQMEAFGDFRAKDNGFPVSEYHFLFQILDMKAYHGVEHQTSTVIALGPGNAIMNTPLYDELLGVSSHELYHTWNVKAIRPIEMQPYDYSTENYSYLGYVAEGVTTYMGDLYLSAAGVKDFKWYQKELEKLLQRHLDNFGRFNLSVAESSWDTWLDGYVPGAPHRKVSIYNEGSLLSFVVDILIRHNSNNKHSLHDVMKKLYDDFGKTGKGYSVDDFKSICSELASENLEEFFSKYYHGTNGYMHILTEAFDRIGLQVELKPNPFKSEDLFGFKTVLIDSKTIVKLLHPGGSAELAGIAIDDEILAINKHALSDNLEELARYFEESEIEITVNRMGRKLSMKLPNTNMNHFPIGKLSKSPTPSNIAKRIFKSWCGYAWDDVNLS